MNAEDQLLTIADVHGWDGIFKDDSGVYCGHTSKKVTPAVYVVNVPIPDYINDRNALYAVINYGVHCPEEYAKHLVQIVLGYDFWKMPLKHQMLNTRELYRLTMATNAQLREALLKTLDLWKP